MADKTGLTADYLAGGVHTTLVDNGDGTWSQLVTANTRSQVWDPIGLAWVREQQALTNAQLRATPVTTAAGDVDPRIENVFDGAGNLIYQGKANPGSATSAAAWMVKKLVYDGAGNLLRILFAGGSVARVNVFDNYLALAYS